MVEFVPVADLVLRAPHAPGDFRRVVAGACAQSGFQRCHVRRQDENADHVVRQCVAQLPVALPVDVEHHVEACRQRGLHRCARRAVGVAAEHLRPFQQSVRCHQAGERCLGAKMIVHAVGFAGPRRACRDADRQAQCGIAVDQRIRDGGLARAGWGGQHQAKAASRDHGHRGQAGRKREVFGTGAGGCTLMVPSVAVVASAPPRRGPHLGTGGACARVIAGRPLPAGGRLAMTAAMTGAGHGTAAARHGSPLSRG